MHEIVTHKVLEPQRDRRSGRPTITIQHSTTRTTCLDRQLRPSPSVPLPQADLSTEPTWTPPGPRKEIHRGRAQHLYARVCTASPPRPYTRICTVTPPRSYTRVCTAPPPRCITRVCTAPPSRCIMRVGTSSIPHRPTSLLFATRKRRIRPEANILFLTSTTRLQKGASTKTERDATLVHSRTTTGEVEDNLATLFEQCTTYSESTDSPAKRSDQTTQTERCWTGNPGA